MAIGGLIMLGAQSAIAYLIGYGIAGFGLGVLIANSYPLLFEMVPSAMRGQGTAIYMIVGNIVGMGMGPLCVAILTQLVFRNDMMAYASVGIITLSCAIGSFGLMLLLRRNSWALRSRLAADGEASAHEV